MSCENPTTDSDALMPRRRKYDKTKICVRCKERRGNIVARHAVYCRECYVPLMTFKFRRSLEPFVNAKPDGPRRTALKPTGNLLVGFSGGLGSTVLLDLIHRCYVCPDPTLVTSEGGKEHPRNEQVWKKVTVSYVEVSDAIPGTRDRTEDIRAIVSRLDGVEFLPLRLQDAFDPSWWEKVGADPANPGLGADFRDELLHIKDFARNDSPKSALHAYLASLPTPTALTSAVQTLVRLLLQYTAVYTASSHLVLGTSLTSLAISLISSVVQGGGFHVKEEIQEEWFPDHLQDVDGSKKKRTSVRVIRPLRDVGIKECAVWAWWMRLPIVGRERIQWPGAKPGLGRLTQDFIMGLEKDYPSTVSTIVRTCGKLTPKGDTAGKCVVCQRPVQSGIGAWKAQIAIRSGAELGKQPVEREAPSSDLSLSSFLCYVCHTTFTSKGTRAPGLLYPDEYQVLPTPTSLPTWTTSYRSLRNPNAEHSPDDNVGEVEDEEIMRGRKLNQSEMRDVVNEFLLDD